MSFATSSAANAQQRILSSLSLVGHETISVATLQRDLSLDQQTTADALRALMKAGKVGLQRNDTDGNYYVTLSNSMPEGPSRVLDAIRASGNNGVDQATLCSKIRLPKSEIIKSLHLLVTQKRIKERRCFSNRAKRIYLLFEFEPSDEVTGGTFYGGEDSREMDVWFVDEMRRCIVSFVAQRHSVSLEQITQHLHETPGSSGGVGADVGSSNAVVITAFPGGSIATSANGNKSGGKRISQRDTQVLVQTLILDGILDCVTPSAGAPAQYQMASGRNVMRHFTAISTGAGSRSFGGDAANPLDDGRELHPDLLATGFWGTALVAQASAWAMPALGLPCLGCPQLPVCSTNGVGVVNPRTCAYMNEWLS